MLAIKLLSLENPKESKAGRIYRIGKVNLYDSEGDIVERGMVLTIFHGVEDYQKWSVGMLAILNPSRWEVKTDDPDTGRRKLSTRAGNESSWRTPLPREESHLLTMLGEGRQPEQRRDPNQDLARRLGKLEQEHIDLQRRCDMLMERLQALERRTTGAHDGRW